VNHTSETLDGIDVVTLHASVLGKQNRHSLKKSLAEVMDPARPTVIDFGDVDSFDCAGLSLIIHWLAESRKAGGSLVLCSESVRVRALIEMVRIPSFVPVASSRAEALETCRNIRCAAGETEASVKNVVSRPRAAAVSGA
jgi:anti-anti-sigma factor